MKIIIGADHLGVKMKDMLVTYLKENEIEVMQSTYENHKLDDYTDFAFEIGQTVVKENMLGILICGNGIGMSIAANKVKGVRAARCLTVDDAFKCKNHNGANVIALSSEVDYETTKEMIDTFLFTKSANEERYLRRVNKITGYERNNNEY